MDRLMLAKLMIETGTKLNEHRIEIQEKEERYCSAMNELSELIMVKVDDETAERLLFRIEDYVDEIQNAMLTMDKGMGYLFDYYDKLEQDAEENER